MEESFKNNYVVEVEHGHPGRTSYTVFSTRDHMSELVGALSNALAKPEASLRESWQSDSTPAVLWSEYATTAFGQSSRVYLTFSLCKDLERFHVRPGLYQRLGSAIPPAILIFLVTLLFVLALVGIGTVIRWFAT